MDDRRRGLRQSVQVPARLSLPGGRRLDVMIRTSGELGVLVYATDLEVEIHEGERALLEHPVIMDGAPTKTRAKTTALVVRVELDMEPGAIVRHIALFFDGGPSPA